MIDESKVVDPASPAFKTAHAKTQSFTDKVVRRLKLAYNPEEEIVQSVSFGLTRNYLIYGKRYCPCFFVTGEKESDRICPCKPALEEEIPQEGKCHCGIFCTPAYAAQQKSSDLIEEAVHQHSRGLTEKECELLLQKAQLDSAELEALLDARGAGLTDFQIVDVREPMEYKQARIKGTDHLVPTTQFYSAIESLSAHKETPLILYCHVGSRSGYCQQIMTEMGFKQVGNLTHGIVSFRGEMERG
jgi:ferredoxin-thioredoxin reductase catalytic subunit/rhodanese-related sulfurtransferase